MADGGKESWVAEDLESALELSNRLEDPGLTLPIARLTQRPP